MTAALPFGERPLDHTRVHTEDLPATPQRERTIPASAWIEAPPELLVLGEDIGTGEAGFIRRIGRWLLWRTGPATKADARYLAVAADDLSRQVTFRLWADGRTEGVGPSGAKHNRFRAWKEDLRDSG